MHATPTITASTKTGPAQIYLQGKAGDRNFAEDVLFTQAMAELYTSVRVQSTALFESDWKDLLATHSSHLPRNRPLIYVDGILLQNSSEQLRFIAREELDFHCQISLFKQSRAAKETLSSLYRTLHPKRNYVYFTFSFTAGYSETVNLQLFNDICPRTCQNFENFCEQKLYKSNPVHKIVQGKFVQSGDFVSGGGNNSISFEHWKNPESSNKFFPDECFERKFDAAGLLAMANEGRRHSNGSQFFITLSSLSELNKRNVVFGRVISGFRTIKDIDKLPLTSQLRPKHPAFISDCGILHRNI